MKNQWLYDFLRGLFDGQKKARAGDCGREEKAEKTFLAMGTVISFTAYGRQAPKALEASEALMMKLDALLSRKKPDSEIAKLNLLAGEGWLTVQEDTDAALLGALRYAEKTEGAYDPAIGALVDVWAVGSKKGALPSGEEIQRALACCQHKNLERDGAGRYRIQKGASVDLGGIGKGYAADRVCTLCQQRGVRSALLSFGTSSIAALGTKPDGAPWKIGLKTADTAKIECFGIVRLHDQFLSTSGDYQQCFVKDGKRYHHILDKATGYPADNGLRMVTVIAQSGAMSEAYSTALFVMGLEKALAFQKREGGFEAVFVMDDKRVVCTPGARALFDFKGEALGYEYVQN